MSDRTTLIVVVLLVAFVWGALVGLAAVAVDFWPLLILSPVGGYAIVSYLPAFLDPNWDE